MSGFEVVGVVLGAIPLVLSALNACKSTKKTILLIRKKDDLLDQLIQSLREQEFLIQTDICLALKKTDLTETDIIDMLNDAGFNMFQNGCASRSYGARINLLHGYGRGMREDSARYRCQDQWIGIHLPGIAIT